MKWSTEEPRERETKSTEVLVLRVHDVPDHIRLDSGGFPPEALSDAVPRSRPGNNVVILTKCQEVRVVQVDGVLEGQERPDGRIGDERLVDLSKRARG